MNLLKGITRCGACSHLHGAPHHSQQGQSSCWDLPASPVPLGPHRLSCCPVSLLWPHRLPSRLRGTSGHGTFTFAAPSALPRAQTQLLPFLQLFAQTWSRWRVCPCPLTFSVYPTFPFFCRTRIVFLLLVAICSKPLGGPRNSTRVGRLKVPIEEARGPSGILQTTCAGGEQLGRTAATAAWNTCICNTESAFLPLGLAGEQHFRRTSC